MQLRDLPNDILRLVLEAALRTCGTIAIMLKSNLPLLAVCRRWRRLALTAVYTGVNIRYDAQPIRRRSRYGNTRAKNAAGNSDRPKLAATNLDIVVSAGCAQTVSEVDIHVDYKANLLPGLGAAIQLMHAAAKEWRGVKKLRISTRCRDYRFSRSAKVADYKDEIKQTSIALAATVPRVSCVSFDACDTSSIARELYGQLVVLCSDRLEGLASQNPIVVPPDHTFRQLKSVSIAYGDRIGYQHPRVDPAKLVSLNLVSWPSNHSWAPFSAGDSSGVIEFPNLEELRLSYPFTRATDGVEARHPDGHPWELHFPRLGKLDVSSNQDRCPLLEYAVLPPRMYEISINATTSLLVRMAGMRPPVSKNIKIAVSTSFNGDPAALAAANRILKGARESKRVELRVSDCSLVVLPESITCTSLTALSIDADTSVDTMLGFIRMLPNLTSLSIRRLTLHDIQEDISVPGPDEDCLVEPFNAKVKDMLIEASLGGQRLEMLVPVAKYLLLRTPALTWFWSKVLPRGPI